MNLDMLFRPHHVASLRQAQPRLTYYSLREFGAVRPTRLEPGYDGPPLRVGVQVLDLGRGAGPRSAASPPVSPPHDHGGAPWSTLRCWKPRSAG